MKNQTKFILKPKKKQKTIGKTENGKCFEANAFSHSQMEMNKLVLR